MSLTTTEVANRLTECVRAGDFTSPYSELYSADIVSVEGGEGQTANGMAAVEEKAKQFMDTMTVISCNVEGPFPSGDKFGLVYEMEVEQKSSGQRFPMKELAVYTVADGKIVHEQFFYSMG